MPVAVGHVHMATPGQDDNLITADQEIYYGHMFGEDSKSQKTNLGPFPEHQMADSQCRAQAQHTFQDRIFDIST